MCPANPQGNVTCSALQSRTLVQNKEWDECFQENPSERKASHTPTLLSQAQGAGALSPERTLCTPGGVDMAKAPSWLVQVQPRPGHVPSQPVLPSTLPGLQSLSGSQGSEGVALQAKRGQREQSEASTVSSGQNMQSAAGRWDAGKRHGGAGRRELTPGRVEGVTRETARLSLAEF